MPVEVNTAALEACIEATKQLIQIKRGLGLEAVSYVLGESDPVELDSCVDMLERKLNRAMYVDQFSDGKATRCQTMGVLCSCPKCRE